jgi:hypothetical protein
MHKHERKALEICVPYVVTKRIEGVLVMEVQIHDRDANISIADHISLRSFDGREDAQPGIWDRRVCYIQVALNGGGDEHSRANVRKGDRRRKSPRQARG